MRCEETTSRRLMTWLEVTSKPIGLQTQFKILLIRCVSKSWRIPTRSKRDKIITYHPRLWWDRQEVKQSELNVVRVWSPFQTIQWSRAMMANLLPQVKTLSCQIGVKFSRSPSSLWSLCEFQKISSFWKLLRSKQSLLNRQKGNRCTDQSIETIIPGLKVRSSSCPLFKDPKRQEISLKFVQIRGQFRMVIKTSLIAQLMDH